MLVRYCECYIKLEFLIRLLFFLLVAIQPDLGTAIIILTLGLIAIFYAGINLIYPLLSLIVLGLASPFLWTLLKPYQQNRVMIFLNPDLDPLGKGYHIIQSKIAIGSGGVRGNGFLGGSQSSLDFLPEVKTDFIFSVYAEEFGFFGSVFILMLYALIISRIIKAGNVTRSNFGKLYCYSFATAFFSYVAVNMSMVLGLLPIVGSPLPILSYGGSSMLAMMIGLGIVMSCKVYHQDELS